MKEHFKYQLERKPIISKEKLSELQGKYIYGSYKAGDQFLIFFEQEIKKIDPPEKGEFGIYDERIIMRLQTITDRDLDKLEQDYKFIRTGAEGIPVLERKQE